MNLLDLAEQPLPIAGTTPRSRHASWTGAVVALSKRAQLQRRYLELLTNGPQTDQEAADALHVLRCSINSTRAALVKAGYVEAGELVKNEQTGAKNCRWALTVKGIVAALAGE